jgi:hypothetical protein
MKNKTEEVGPTYVALLAVSCAMCFMHGELSSLVFNGIL